MFSINDTAMTETSTIIYGRYSSDKQNADSAKEQIRRCREFAADQGWNIVDEFSDEAISGRYSDRPGYNRIKDAIENKRCKIVLAEALDRFSRDQEESAKLFKLAQFHGVELHTIKERKISLMTLGLGSTMNSLYLEYLSMRTRNGLASRVDKGKFAGGKAYGYRTKIGSDGHAVVGEREIVPEEAEIVKRIMTEYANGISPKKIATDLNLDKIPSPSGKHWKANTIQGSRERRNGILNNELYIGQHVWNKLHYVYDPEQKGRISRLNSTDQLKVNEHPELRIIDQALWDKVKARQAAFDAKRAAYNTGDKNGLSGSQATRRSRHLLSGLIHCGCCGGKMNIGGSKPKRYYCANAREKGRAVCPGIGGVKKDTLEQSVVASLAQGLMVPQAVKLFLEEYAKQHAAMDNARNSEHRRKLSMLRKSENQQKNLINSLTQGKYIAAVEDRLVELSNDIEMLKADLKDLEDEAPKLPDNLAELYHEKIDDLSHTLNNPTTLPEAIDAVQKLVESVTVSKDGKVMQIELVGQLAEILRMTGNEKTASNKEAVNSLKLVAGAGFEPATFRL
ncbi:recombinase family protein [Thalassospira tepidiphila]|uniref:recombinase family protein n=3 Tax=Thalassospira tepidiphila TaxID=393657 RepID=UPI003381BF55